MKGTQTRPMAIRAGGRLPQCLIPLRRNLGIESPTDPGRCFARPATRRTSEVRYRPVPVHNAAANDCTWHQEYESTKLWTFCDADRVRG
jgi:hypothetical protein